MGVGRHSRAQLAVCTKGCSRACQPCSSRGRQGRKRLECSWECRERNRWGWSLAGTEAGVAVVAAWGGGGWVGA